MSSDVRCERPAPTPGVPPLTCRDVARVASISPALAALVCPDSFDCRGLPMRIIARLEADGADFCGAGEAGGGTQQGATTHTPRKQACLGNMPAAVATCAHMHKLLHGSVQATSAPSDPYLDHVLCVTPKTPTPNNLNPYHEHHFSGHVALAPQAGGAQDGAVDRHVDALAPRLCHKGARVHPAPARGQPWPFVFGCVVCAPTYRIE
jgi:hypothetical protein